MKIGLGQSGQNHTLKAVKTLQHEFCQNAENQCDNNANSRFVAANSVLLQHWPHVDFQATPVPGICPMSQPDATSCHCCPCAARGSQRYASCLKDVCHWKPFPFFFLRFFRSLLSVADIACQSRKLSSKSGICINLCQLCA